MTALREHWCMTFSFFLQTLLFNFFVMNFVKNIIYQKVGLSETYIHFIIITVQQKLTFFLPWFLCIIFLCILMQNQISPSLNIFYLKGQKWRHFEFLKNRKFSMFFRRHFVLGPNIKIPWVCSHISIFLPIFLKKQILNPTKTDLETVILRNRFWHGFSIFHKAKYYRVRRA